MFEKQIKVAAKLYEFRDTAKRIYGDEYHEKIKPYMDLIKEATGDKEVLPVVMEMSKHETIQYNGILQMLLWAAAVEIIEPSENHRRK